VPEENFWTLWCKGRLTEADTQTIRLGATPSGLTSAYLHHPPFFTVWMPFLPPNQQCQSIECNNINSGNNNYTFSISSTVIVPVQCSVIAYLAAVIIINKIFITQNAHMCDAFDSC